MGYFLELNDLMVKYCFRPDKKMAQFFIIDEFVATKLIELGELKKTDNVLEIGSGTGFLTRELQKQCNVIAIELDDALFELLEKELQKENLELLHGDFRKIELPKFNKIISLPPYTCSSDIVLKLIESNVEIAVLVFQKEFVEKLMAQPGFLEYSAMSVLTQSFFDLQFVQTIKADSFFPKPNAVSAIVKFTAKKDSMIEDKKLFEIFVKQLFRFQKKNLRNALNHSFQFLEKDLNLSEETFLQKVDSLKNCDEKLNLLEVKEFAELFNLLFQKEKIAKIEKPKEKRVEKNPKKKAKTSKKENFKEKKFGKIKKNSNAKK